MPCIYIVQLKQHVMTESPIYKIGRTKNDIINRISSYEKGTVLKFVEETNHENNIENLIKKKIYGII